MRGPALFFVSFIKTLDLTSRVAWQGLAAFPGEAK